MKNFLKNIIKSLAVSALIITLYAPQAPCMKEKIKNAKAKIQHDLDSIENRLKHVIPALANSKLWTKLCTYACITAARFIQSVGQPKPLKVSLLKKDVKENQLYLAKYNKHQNEDLIVSSPSKLKYFIVPLIILFIQFPTAEGSRPDYPICHNKSDGTEQCCNYQWNSAEITCCRFNISDSKALACQTINPEVFFEESLIKFDILSLTKDRNEQSSYHRINIKEQHLDPLCWLDDCPLDQRFDKFQLSHNSFSREAPLEYFIQIEEPLTSFIAHISQLIKDYTQNHEIIVKAYKPVNQGKNAYVEYVEKFYDDNEQFYTVNKYVIILTTDLIHFFQKSPTNLIGVAAHEVGHIISNYDIFFSKKTISSRSTTNKENDERTADILGGLLTEHPRWLAQALCHLESPDEFDHEICPNTALSTLCKRGRVQTQYGYPPTICRIIMLLNLENQYQRLDQSLTEAVSKIQKNSGH